MVHISRATTLSEKGKPYPKAPPRNTNLQLDAGSRTNAQSKDRPEAQAASSRTHRCAISSSCSVPKEFQYPQRRSSASSQSGSAIVPMLSTKATEAQTSNCHQRSKQCIGNGVKRAPPPLLGRITPKWGRFPGFGNLGCNIGSGSDAAVPDPGPERGNP